MTKTTKEILAKWEDLYGDGTDKAVGLCLKEKWYSEEEVLAIFEKIENADMSHQFKQRMMTISQGDILLIPRKELEKIKLETLGGKINETNNL